jgi:TatD DNase family protein
VPHRGRRNEPAWVVHTLAVLAALRSARPDEVAALVNANFAALLGGDGRPA